MINLGLQQRSVSLAHLSVLRRVSKYVDLVEQRSMSIARWNTLAKGAVGSNSCMASERRTSSPASIRFKNHLGWLTADLAASMPRPQSI